MPSTDIYRGQGGPQPNMGCGAPDFVNATLRWFYDKYILGRLAPHQRVVLVPGAKYRSTDCALCDASCMSKSMLADAKEILVWAQAEPRIVAITPYLYKSFPPEYGLHDLQHMCPTQQQQSPCRQLFDFWRSIGETIKNRTAYQLGTQSI